MKKVHYIFLFLLAVTIFSGKAQNVSTLVPEFPGDGEFSFDLEGNLYVNDSGENGALDGDAVYKVNPTTGTFSLFRSELPIWVVGSVFDAAGNLLVTGWSEGIITRISLDGTTAIPISEDINGAGSLALDNKGNIYVVEYIDNTVLQFDSDGTYIKEFSNDSKILNPAGLVYSETKEVFYVSNWTTGEILEINAHGNATVIATLEVPNAGPMKLFGNYLIVTAPLHHVIYKIDLNNPQNVTVFAGIKNVKGNLDGAIGTATFDTPTGIGSLNGETWYVTENFEGTGRLRVIEEVVLDTPHFNERVRTRIYPNPSQDILKIDFGEAIAEDVQITVFDINGKKIQVPFRYSGM